MHHNQMNVPIILIEKIQGLASRICLKNEQGKPLIREM